MDKYRSFYEILPEVRETPADQREVVSEILNACCNELIRMFSEPVRPTKPMLKKALIYCMDELSIARVCPLNREFGYQLGWFLAEKVSVDLRKGTEKKVWGFWRVEDSEVQIPVRPRNTARKKARMEG